MSADRVRYPAIFYRAAIFENMSRALYFAGMESENPLIRDVFDALQYAQPPRPDDKLADQGATHHQIEVMADLFGLDEAGRKELYWIIGQHGMSARHAALICGHGLQRDHEIDELEKRFADEA